MFPVKTDYDWSQRLNSLHPDLHSSPLRVCVVGLHCCGPLSPSILKLLTEHLHHPSLRVLLLLGCCYHKTEHVQWSPLSYALTELLSTRTHSFNLGTFGLRLAAQETRDRYDFKDGNRLG